MEELLTISLERVRMFGNHGVFVQEQTVGAEYEVSIVITMPPPAGCDTDLLDNTLSYAQLYESLKREFAIHSDLIEHLAKRIAIAITDTWPYILSAEIKITKLAPPIPSFQGSAAVKYTWRRSIDSR